jgi:glycine/D-amino acid oxidase-like deaminating enzyme
MAAIGFGLEACAPKTSPAIAPASLPRNTPRVLPMVHASWDRVIRTTIGLRPHRDSGFLLKADKLDAKTVIHNFGHGGSGMSISWGTASLAVDLAVQQPDRRAAVLGCGVVGLTTARELQRRGFDVTIYAATVPPDTTSNMSLAGFTPTSGLVQTDRRTPEWDAQFRQAVQIAYRRLQLLVGPKYGITWINQYALTNELDQQGRGGGGGGNPLMPDTILNPRVILQPGEHPFATTYAVELPTMRIEPSIYLDALMHDVALFGGKIVIRRFETPRDLMALPDQVIVNCTGLGARQLFNDSELVPLKGQLTVMVPQAEVNYSTNGGSSIPSPPNGLPIHMMPRSDGIVLGGTSQRDVWTTDVDETERKRIVDSHIQVFSGMKTPARMT